MDRCELAGSCQQSKLQLWRHQPLIYRARKHFCFYQGLDLVPMLPTSEYICSRQAALGMWDLPLIPTLLRRTQGALARLETYRKVEHMAPWDSTTPKAKRPSHLHSVTPRRHVLYSQRHIVTANHCAKELTSKSAMVLETLSTAAMWDCTAVRVAGVPTLKVSRRRLQVEC